MPLLLANSDLHQDWATLAAARYEGFDATEFAAAQARDIGEYQTVGSDAVINVSGPISYKFDFWSYYFGGTSYQGILAQIQAANGNTNIDRIVMVFDTPGGDITGLIETAQAIRDNSKPIVAVVDPVCASAGLWLASQTSRIVCIESGEVGSLGVQMKMRSFAEYYQQLGVDVKLIRASISPDKNLGNLYEPLSEEATAYWQEKVDRAGKKFVSAVAEGRNVSESTVLDKFGKGKMLIASDAIDVGLIDEIGSLGGVLAESASGGGGNSQPTRQKRRASLTAKMLARRR